MHMHVYINTHTFIYKGAYMHTYMYIYIVLKNSSQTHSCFFLSNNCKVLKFVLSCPELPLTTLITKITWKLRS